ncbi:MAG: undecaprenyldiphospho-muramoylpentapeptide beta-N-acetylglucosaminyltransferase [Cyclobacteriaceae bacterium]|nr:undecaprenyldiphospho-muramoylpentapeptide beta-N-acetylglucosaminyltransferase [Cyclobacteriaceae bacterium]MCH8516251.1 undecaprenyldiphospho-muramoylpentapeptide beta-N-acetylglucosaminyltransferase [Cyclobacteriaceae bacterium]
MSKLRVIISGGGTGGHVYPAISIGKELKRRYPDAEILFVGAKGRMEMEKVPQAGFEIKGLWISGIQRSLSIDNLSFPFKLMSSLWTSFALVSKFKPDIAIGVGGFASGPMLYAAARRGVPCLIQEQNSFAGLTNKLLAKQIKTVCVAHDKMERFFPYSRVVNLGNPVRKEVVSSTLSSSHAKEKLGLDPNRICVFVLGGSLGARTLNESVLGGWEKFEAEGVQLVWQTGKLYEQEMSERLKGKKNLGVVSAFIEDMGTAYAAADVVISRSGAISVSELCLVAKPVVFVPSPNVAENHQEMNALSIVEKGGAIMVKDSAAQEQLIDRVLDLCGDEDTRKTLAKNIGALAKPNALSDIVDEIENLIPRKKKENAVIGL